MIASTHGVDVVLKSANSIPEYEKPDIAPVERDENDGIAKIMSGVLGIIVITMTAASMGGFLCTGLLVVFYQNCMYFTTTLGDRHNISPLR